MLPRLPSCARAVLGVVLAAAAFAGCGGSSSSSGSGLASKSPEQIVAAAKAAAADAATVHLAGSIIKENKPISLDMELVAGKGAKGHISLEGLGVDVVEVEHAFYIKGSAAFYRRIAGSAAAQLLEGKWLKAPASGGELRLACAAHQPDRADRLDAGKPRRAVERRNEHRQRGAGGPRDGHLKGRNALRRRQRDGVSAGDHQGRLERRGDRLRPLEPAGDAARRRRTRSTSTSCRAATEPACQSICLQRRRPIKTASRAVESKVARRRGPETRQGRESSQ